MLIDNDDGAKEIFSLLKKKYNISVNLKSTESFYYVTHNLYFVKTMESAGDGKSSIEDAFEQSVRDTLMRMKCGRNN